MCGGASQQETDIQAKQAAYYSVLTAQAQQEFGQASKIFSDLTSTFEPILKAGPGQEGFTAGELNNLNSVAATTQGQSYATTEQAVNRQLAATGAGMLPSGVATQIRTGLAGSAAQNLASEQQQIKMQDYNIGHENWLTAAQALSGSTGVYNAATGAAGAANQGGSAAAQTAEDISAQNNSWMSLVGGALGGVSSAVGSYYGAKCWVAARIWGGWEKPEVHLVRRYIFEDFNRTWYGKILANLYEKHGQWAAKHGIIVSVLKPFFRLALKKAQRKYN